MHYPYWIENQKSTCLIRPCPTVSMTSLEDIEALRFQVYCHNVLPTNQRDWSAHKIKWLYQYVYFYNTLSKGYHNLKILNNSILDNILFLEKLYREYLFRWVQKRRNLSLFEKLFKISHETLNVEFEDLDLWRMCVRGLFRIWWLYTLPPASNLNDCRDWNSEGINLDAPKLMQKRRFLGFFLVIFSLYHNATLPTTSRWKMTS